MGGDSGVPQDREGGGLVAYVMLSYNARAMNYRYIGCSTDGLLIFQDGDYPSDAPQAYPDDAALLRCASTHRLIDGDKFFCINQRHPEVRGLLALTLNR